MKKSCGTIPVKGNRDQSMHLPSWPRFCTFWRYTHWECVAAGAWAKMVLETDGAKFLAFCLCVFEHPTPLMCLPLRHGSTNEVVPYVAANIAAVPLKAVHCATVPLQQYLLRQNLARQNPDDSHPAAVPRLAVPRVVVPRVAVPRVVVSRTAVYRLAVHCAIFQFD